MRRLRARLGLTRDSLPPLFHLWNADEQERHLRRRIWVTRCACGRFGLPLELWRFCDGATHHEESRCQPHAEVLA